MAKKIYRAEFSVGDKVKRQTERTYTHAWAVYRENRLIESGFSGSRALAEKAAAFVLPTDHEAAFKRKRRGRSPFSAAYAVKSTMKWLNEYHEGSWEKYQESRQALLAQLRVEIVECKEALR